MAWKEESSGLAAGFLKGEEALALCQTSKECVIRKGKNLFGSMIKVALWLAGISGQTETNVRGQCDGGPAEPRLKSEGSGSGSLTPNKLSRIF